MSLPNTVFFLHEDQSDIIHCIEHRDSKCYEFSFEPFLSCPQTCLSGSAWPTDHLYTSDNRAKKRSIQLLQTIQTFTACLCKRRLTVRNQLKTIAWIVDQCIIKLHVVMSSQSYRITFFARCQISTKIAAGRCEFRNSTTII